MDWYSLRVISGKEKSAEENILRDAGDNDITHEIEEVFVPFEKVVEMRNNKKRIREKMFFPGYILIKMNLTANTKYVVENVPGVLSFVGPKGNKPVPLRERMKLKEFLERLSGKRVWKLLTFHSKKVMLLKLLPDRLLISPDLLKL